MRIRTIKPEFWSSYDIVRFSDRARLLAIGLLNYSDDEGYFYAKSSLILSAIFPHELDTPIDKLLEELKAPNQLDESYIEVCTGTNGRLLGRVVRFDDHQSVSHPKSSKIKPFWLEKNDSDNNPDLFQEASSNDTGTIQEGSGNVPARNREQGTGKGTGKGKEQGKEGKTLPEKKTARFKPPTIEEVQAYADEKGLIIDAEKFCDYFISVGWTVGKSGKKMKDWKAAVRTWVRRGKEFSSEKSSSRSFERDNLQYPVDEEISNE